MLEETPRPPARRGEVRRRQLLQTAARLLLRDGIGRASMDLIAAEARASKATLYRHFGDKHGLVVEVVAWLCDDFVQDIPCPRPDAPLYEGLHTVLSALILVLDKPNHPDFFRLVVEGARLDPAIGRAWYEHGPLFWHRLLQDVLDRARASGEIPPGADTARYPEVLFDAVFANRIIRTAVLVPQDPDAAPSVTSGDLETLLHAVETAIHREVPATGLLVPASVRPAQ